MSETNGTPLNWRQRMELVANAITLRQQLAGQFLDPRRNIEHETGAPPVDQPVPLEIYTQLFEREPVAARVVQVLPRESWQVQPSVFEVEDDEETEFEAAWNSLASTLRGEDSFYQDESGSPVWEYLQRADEQSGIGSYGVIFLGLNDGLDPRFPVEGWPADPIPYGTDAQYFQQGIPRPQARGKGKPKERRLLFLRVFPESLAQITRYDSDPRSPRYGQPLSYLITLNDPARSQQAGVGLSTATMEVHYSRIIHIADNLESSEVFGSPRMRPVLNNLLGLRKLYGGSPEMYWKGAFPGYYAATDPALGGDVGVNFSQTKDEIEQWANGLQRTLMLNGMTMNGLSPQVVDPTGQIQVQIQAICIVLGIPQRVFMGSERGELASSQDDAAWNDRLRFRQANYITPRIIVPFIDRLIALGVLPVPKSMKNKRGRMRGYSVSWPDLTSQSDQEKATVAATILTALGTYVSGGVEALIPPKVALTRFVGMTDEEADSALKEAEKAKQEQQAQAQQTADQHGFKPTPPPGFKEPQPEEPQKPGLFNLNSFCPTGQGGGVDPSCGKEGGGSGGGGSGGGAGGAVKTAVGAAKGAAAALGHIEHKAIEGLKSLGARGISKLPPRGQRLVARVGAITHGLVKTAFTNFRMVQALTERAMVKRGLGEEYAASMRSTLSSVDNKTFEVFKGIALAGYLPGLHALHAAHPLAALTATVPVASAGYLAYSTARNPLATLRAAAELTRETASSAAGGVKALAWRLKGKPGAPKAPTSAKPRLEALEARNALDELAAFNASLHMISNADEEITPEQERMADMLAESLEAHDNDDWYIAMLSAALDQTGNLEDAIILANATYEANPEDRSEPQDDDEEAIFGKEESEGA